MPTGYCRKCNRPQIDLRRRLCGACYQRARRKPDFHGWADAGPVRAHLQALHASGLGQRAIAKLAGIDRTQIRNITVGRRAQDKTHAGPARFCHPNTAAAILAIPVPEPDRTAIAHRELRVALNPRTTSRRRSNTPTWLDRYTELKSLGYSDIEIMRKFDYRADSMIRQLERHGLSPEPTLAVEAKFTRTKRATA